MRSIHYPHIAGLGAVSGYGWGVNALWDGLSSGKPAASLHHGFGTNDDESGWIVRVPDEDLSAGHTPQHTTTRFARAMRAVVHEAVTDAQQRGWVPGARVGLIHACVLGDLDMYPKVAPGAGTFTGREYLTVTPSTPVSLLMSEFGFHGPALTVSAMCTSGVAATVTAKMWIDAGLADDVVVVATDLSATPEVVRMFTTLGVAITDTDPLDACRPFQSGSRGFTFGEAAVATVVTGRRGVDPYATIRGGSMSHDGYHVTSIDPNLPHVFGCVDNALTVAGVSGADIAYLNTHGPGTRQCDAAEAAIATSLVPDAAVFAIKPLSGHCQAAAGSVEMAASLLGFEHGQIPASPHVSTPALPQLLDGCTAAQPALTLKTSLGMGGHTAAVVLEPGC